MTLVLALWAASALLVVPFLQSLRVDPLLSTNPPPSWVAPVLWSAWLGFAFLLLCRVAYLLLDWRQDWIALTTRRVIVMNKSLFVREERRECPIGKVQNVIAEFPNPIGMAFDFGDLSVDTAGVGTLSFKDLPHPELIREAIFKQQEILRSKQPAAEDLRREALRSIILGQDPLRRSIHSATGRGPAWIVSREEPPTGAAPVSGYGLFNSFFPIAPQRDGARVTWRKHWSCLVRGLSTHGRLPPNIRRLAARSNYDTVMTRRDLQGARWLACTGCFPRLCRLGDMELGRLAQRPV